MCTKVKHFLQKLWYGKKYLKTLDQMTWHCFLKWDFMPPLLSISQAQNIKVLKV